MKSNILTPASLALLGCLAATSAAQATVISVSGSGLIIGAPAFIGNSDNPLSTHQQGFNERQGVTLIGPLPVDGGSVGAAGMLIDSHMIFFNQSGTGPLSTTAIWTFSGTILGVMSDINGTLEAASSGFLGAPGTLGYPGPGGFTSRGMESDDGYSGVGTTSLTVRMNIAQPGDWIRVITVRTPDAGNTAILLALALLGLPALRRFSNRLPR